MLNRLIENHNKEVRDHNDFHLIDNVISQKIIKENTQKNVSNWLRVASDITTVEVSTTSNTREYVLSFYDSKGNGASLWLAGNKIRDITPY